MEIEHRHLSINNLNLHIAQIGKDELGTVIFLHGFPEIWYSWRHQMVAVAEAGYRAIAPDWRGYGLSDQPPDPQNASWQHLISDLLGLFDALSISKAFLVGKDFGSFPAYLFALLYPDRICGVVSIGMPYLPIPISHDPLPEGFYINRWQEPGRAEIDFGRFDVKRVVRTIYILFSRSEMPIAPEGKEIMDLADLSTPLPEWFTEEDLSIYASLYEKNGFTYPLQIPYRAMHNMGGINVPPDLTIQVPVLLIKGEADYSYKHPRNYQKEGIMQKYVRDLEITFIPDGCHFVQEQLLDQVNQLIIRFVKSHPMNT
ncbi:alpha/beta-Hydrolases superfamily protein [Rhynchospora pubera]|uniref:Alpha/beta-Hydrolases superfamily protein n=1 Tax=Rhynchospora pubera TaxID=906938 RepID=A0AAV8BHM9_9POAL|nr:alpha/beta-Hydrolases superfamily protein [Rhynchospora pubera]KAJ4744953.1 alpha/beta-Hydrolases superfamily protein [Rhynchospora pubera]